MRGKVAEKQCDPVEVASKTPAFGTVDALLHPQMDPIHQNAVLQAMVPGRVSATGTEKTFGPYFDPVHIQASSPELEHLDECYKPPAIRSCLASFLGHQTPPLLAAAKTTCVFLVATKNERNGLLLPSNGSKKRSVYVSASIVSPFAVA